MEALGRDGNGLASMVAKAGYQAVRYAKGTAVICAAE